MGLIPSIMYEALVITPIEDFPKVVIELAETERFMPTEALQIEGLEEYCSSARIDTIRKIEQDYFDWDMAVTILEEIEEELNNKDR